MKLAEAEEMRRGAAGAGKWELVEKLTDAVKQLRAEVARLRAPNVVGRCAWLRHDRTGEGDAVDGLWTLRHLMGRARWGASCPRAIRLHR